MRYSDLDLNQRLLCDLAARLHSIDDMWTTTHSGVGDEAGRLRRSLPRVGAVLASEQAGAGRQFVTFIGVLRERAFQDVAEVVKPAH